MAKTTKFFETADGRFVFEYRFSAGRAPRSMYNDEDREADYAAFEASEIILPMIGSTYMVATDEYVGPNGDKPSSLSYREDNGEGWAGNMDASDRRYHGWRGTTDDWSVQGRGIRKVLSATVSGKRSKLVRIVFGRDLKKDED